MGEADVGLKEVQTALEETKNILSKNLIPGSESISVVTQNVADLAHAVDKTIKEGGANAENIVKTVKGAINKLWNKAYGLGVNLRQFTDMVYEKLGESAKATVEDTQLLNIKGK
eukprot:NODE_4740_length_422_cov_654.525469_g3748_i0.p1 GENE.NODE_4740_length_422_cov_654.525469_g3748_i0~~NODE_4740_length_422_cov_654.525469_g3748_i0.p1  ORF type:complete len:122 (+),score=22.91 NODE_4740_length_422_cov_654.525469_g3748_i0:26-367(+)